MPAAPPAELLAALPLLEGAERTQIEALAAAMGLAHVAAGTVLGRQGDAGDCFWLLLEGRVEVSVLDAGGRSRHRAPAGPGAILGELALLRRRPRTATVTAVDACTYATGGHQALEVLLSIDPVRSRVRRLASRRLAEDLQPVPARLGDLELVLRPLLPEDRAALHDALRGLSRESLRRRFFSAGTPSEQLIEYLIDIDYVDHFAWAALDAGGRRGLATARYVRGPGTEAEMAFTTIDGFQGRGIGTLLFGVLGVTALEARVSHLVAYVMEENRPMRRIFAKAGGETSFDDPGVVKVTVEAARAAELVEPAMRERISAAVHDVVTAASLALA